MAEVEECDLIALHDAMVAAIKAKFPAVALVQDYPRVNEEDGKMPIPAIFLEIAQMEPTEDVGNNGNDGTEQLRLNLKLEARCVVGFKGSRQAIASQTLATSLAAFVNNQNWGLAVMPARITGLFPDSFEPDLDRYEVWRVDFEQVVTFGTSAWAGEGETPTKVFAGFTPKIGPPFVNDYLELTDGRIPAG